MKGDKRLVAYTYLDSYSELTFVSNLLTTTKLKDRVILSLLSIYCLYNFANECNSDVL